MVSGLGVPIFRVITVVCADFQAYLRIDVCT